MAQIAGVVLLSYFSISLAVQVTPIFLNEVKDRGDVNSNLTIKNCAYCDFEYPGFNKTRGQLKGSLKSSPNSVQEFWERRNAIADSDMKTLLGSRQTITENELKANRIALSYKYAEYRKETFPPSVNFLHAKSEIEQSEIFEIIRKVPKGAALYSILEASVPLNFLYQLTYDDNLYFRINGNLQFKYSNSKPDIGWRLLSEVRNSSKTEYFEHLAASVERRLSWNQTEEVFTFRDLMHVYRSLISYKPNLEKVLKKALEVFYEDNVMYIQFYYDFPLVYDLDGENYEPLQVLEILRGIVKEFVETHEGFVGARFIYASLDRLTAENLVYFRKTSTELWRRRPDLIAGFGVIRLEEDEEPYNTWVEEFLKFPKEMKLFLDAGLTSNWGVNADYDLYDAIALNSACLAAAITLPKHPAVVEEIRKKNIFVESSPITTQIFLVSDLRLHPLTLLVALDLPIVIVNVASTAWNATGMSYDWYEAYMAMTPRFCDLRCLKQFAVNSITYSSMTNSEKKKSLRIWQEQWDTFISYLEKNYGQP